MLHPFLCLSKDSHRTGPVYSLVFSRRILIAFGMTMLLKARILFLPLSDSMCWRHLRNYPVMLGRDLEVIHWCGQTFYSYKTDF